MELGIFNSFWDGQPNHLPFLNLLDWGEENKDWNLGLSIKKLSKILETNPENTIAEGITQLLRNEDWRSHLIASVSLLVIKPSKRNNLVGIYWERLSKGSWVSPQILVALSIADEDFKIKGEKILANGLKIDHSKLTSIEHHILRGGTGATVSERKIIAATDYLLNGVVNDTNDSDSGGSISRDWKERLLKLIDTGKLSVDEF
jgi:hypothetical protein